MYDLNFIEFIEKNNLDFLSGSAIKHILDSKKNDEADEIRSAISILEKKLVYLDKNRINSSVNNKYTENPKILLKNIEFYFINLDKRTDRLSHVKKELSKINLSAQKYKAIDTLDGCTINFGKDFTEGQKKCYLSHYSLMKNYNVNSDKILGIFEDDVIFCQDFLERFNYVEKYFDLDWDVFYLSSFYHLNDDEKRWNKTGDYEKTNVKYIHRVYGSFCCHSYLINPRSIPKILKLLDEVIDQSRAIDHSFILIQPKLNCFSFTPGMTNQITNTSDTDGGLRDQTHFLNILGQHYYINNLSEFDYDEYFKN